MTYRDHVPDVPVNTPGDDPDVPAGDWSSTPYDPGLHGTASSTRKDRRLGRALAAEVGRRLDAELRAEKAERDLRNCDLEMCRWRERAQRAEATLASMGRRA